MDEQFADELIASGDLTPDWRPSFLAVPRLQFIPDTIWHEVDGLFRPVRRPEDLDRWLGLASGRDSMVTQVDDGCPVGPGDAGDIPTSFISRPISTTDEDDEQASVSQTQLHLADVRNTDHARGAVIAIGSRVLNCRTSYTPPGEDPHGEGVLWVIDHDSDSWARMHHTLGDLGPYRVYQFRSRRLWDEVEAAYQWWIDSGKPGAHRWRFTISPAGQCIELV